MKPHPSVRSGALLATFYGLGRTAQFPPNPDYPEGIDVNISKGAKSCSIYPTYPAPEVGRWMIECKTCGFRGLVTAAGRVDDPRKVTIPCKTN